MKIYRAKIHGGPDCSFWLNLKCQDIADAVESFRDHCYELDTLGNTMCHYFTDLHFLEEAEQQNPV